MFNVEVALCIDQLDGPRNRGLVRHRNWYVVGKGLPGGVVQRGVV
jgi:hypothetical protein